MSEFLISVILGIIQGLTEFLPISSSGHLELANALLGDRKALDSDLIIVILAHLGTAFSIMYIYRSDILNIIKSMLFFRRDEHALLGWKIAVSAIPAVAIGLLLEEQISQIFEGDIIIVGVFLIITGIVLYLTPRKNERRDEVSFFRAGIIGLAQAFAILPGISRSGMTIATALFIGTDSKEAARFSFLMVLPIILGKVALDLLTGDLTISSATIYPISGALISSFLVGIWACRAMIRFVQRGQLKYFAIYCLIVGAITIAFSLYG